MILADDLFLLLHDEQGKQMLSTDSLNVGLAGALLIDLAQAHRIDAPGKDGFWHRRRMVLLSDTPLGDPVLDGALAVVRAKQGKPVTAVITAVTPKLRETVSSRLISVGAVDATEEKVLGVFPRRRWIARNRPYVQQLRHRLRAVLDADIRTEERTRALIALLHAVSGLKKAVSVDGEPPADWSAAKKRAKSMAEADWSAQAVRSVIEAAQTAAAAGASAAAVSAATAAS